jgi:hypothetical protein
MAKVRVVVAEVEGSDAAVLSAIQGVTAVLGRAVVELPAAAPVEVPKAIEAPKESEPIDRFGRRELRSAKKEALSAAASRIAGAGGTKGLSHAIRQAVIDGPKSNGEVLRYVQAHGHPDAKNSSVGTILGQLAKKGEMYKNEADLCWYVAEGK